MTYALGRTVTYQDMPVVRKIVRASEKDDYRFKSIIFNIVTSDAFRMRDNILSASETENSQQASL